MKCNANQTYFKLFIDKIHRENEKQLNAVNGIG